MMSFKVVAAFITLIASCQAAATPTYDVVPTDHDTAICPHLISMRFNTCNPKDFITSFAVKNGINYELNPSLHLQNTTEICIGQKNVKGSFKAIIGTDDTKLKDVLETLYLDFGKDKTIFAFNKKTAAGAELEESPVKISSAYLIDRAGSPLSNEILFSDEHSGASIAQSKLKPGQVVDLHIEFCKA